MSIKYIDGDIFNSNCQTITNPVNTVGVMGRGLALEFKNKYPDYFNCYVNECKNKELIIGKLTIYNINDNKKILSFPTKDHWKNPSKIEYIENGLIYFVKNYKQMNIQSIAFPYLGCGLGGLNKQTFLLLLDEYLSNLNLNIEIYNI